MTSTETSANEWLAKRRTYRRLAFGSVLGGTALGLGLRALDYPLVGEAVYWLGVLAFLAVWLGTSMTLFDERDVAMERRASQLTLYVLAPVLVVGASAARVLPRLTDVTVPPFVSGALYAYISVFVVFGGCLAWLKLR